MSEDKNNFSFREAEKKDINKSKEEKKLLVASLVKSEKLFKNEINKEIDKELSKLYDLFNNKVTVLNIKVKDSQIDLIQLD